MEYMKFINRRRKTATIVFTAYENGNASWQYNRAIAAEGERIDYRFVSYVEDMR